MNVIGHQAIGMYRARIFLRKLVQVKQVQDVVALSEKTGVPVVAALNDMKGNARDYESLLSRHFR
jgi:hypothetical protein